MSEFRIVFNEQTRRYRIERRGLLGWAFVTDAAGDSYLTFESLGEARRCLCRLRRDAASNRRWRVVDGCQETAPAP